MRERTPDLPDWIGSDRSGKTFISISYVWLTTHKPGKAIKIVCVSNFDSAGRIKFGGLDIRPADSSPALKSTLVAHLIGRFKYENEFLKPISDGDGEIELLSKRYAALVEWGDASPALSLSYSSGKPVMEIHNQLKIARRRGYLIAAGQGSRGALIED